MPSSDQTKSVTSGADPKVEIFIAYASEDRELCKGLEKQLRVLQRDGLALIWENGEGEQAQALDKGTRHRSPQTIV